jgi:hypothetical protein
MTTEPITAEEKLSNVLACYDELQSAAGRKYEALRADIKEWSDIAYEMYALLCNSKSLDEAHAEAWQGGFERLKDRFHVALDKLPTGADEVDA